MRAVTIEDLKKGDVVEIYIDDEGFTKVRRAR